MLCARILKLSLLRVQHNNYYNIVVSCILYRHKDYHLYANNMRVSHISPTQVSQPLDLSGLREVVDTARQCLGNNFIPAFLTMVGGLLAFHHEAVVTMDDSCPITICYSQGSGTGRFLCSCVWLK